MVVALIWNVLFLLGLRDTIRRIRAREGSDLRFATKRRVVAWTLAVVGIVLGCGLMVIAIRAVAVGAIDGFCRRCERDMVAFSVDPLAFLLILSACIELALTMYFVTFLARNSLVAIREGRAS